MNQRARSSMKHFALASQLLGLAVTFCSANSAAPTTRAVIPRSGQEDRSDLKLKVIDGATKKPIRNSDIEIYAPNEIRCITAPCPGNDIKWSGKTDDQGFVSIPGPVWTWAEAVRRYVVRRSVTITAVGYRRRMLDHARESKKKGEEMWVIALDAGSGPQRESQ